jgi:hypothetical protein
MRGMNLKHKYLELFFEIYERKRCFEIIILSISTFLGSRGLVGGVDTFTSAALFRWVP